MPSARRGEFRIQQIKRLDDFGSGVRQQRERDGFLASELRDCGLWVVTDRGDAIAACVEFLEALVPGDRLVLAEWSPIEGTGEQDDQPAPPRQGFEIAVLAALIQRGNKLRHVRADLRTPIQRIETGDGGGNRQGR